MARRVDVDCRGATGAKSASRPQTSSSSARRRTNPRVRRSPRRHLISDFYVPTELMDARAHLDESPLEAAFIKIVDPDSNALLSRSSTSPRMTTLSTSAAVTATRPQRARPSGQDAFYPTTGPGCCPPSAPPFAHADSPQPIPADSRLLVIPGVTPTRDSSCLRRPGLHLSDDWRKQEGAAGDRDAESLAAIYSSPLRARARYRVGIARARLGPSASAGRSSSTSDIGGRSSMSCGSARSVTWCAASECLPLSRGDSSARCSADRPRPRAPSCAIPARGGRGLPRRSDKAAVSHALAHRRPLPAS